MALTGELVVVRARLEDRYFTADDETFAYNDGMLGIAEVRLRSERIIETLIPGLKRL